MTPLNATSRYTLHYDTWADPFMSGLSVLPLLDVRPRIGEPGDYGDTGESAGFVTVADFAAWMAGAGLAGPAGPQGIQGDTGSIGPQGPQGIQGVQGIQGSGGTTGATGSAGVNAFSAPNARTCSLATAYQATDPSKPSIVTVNLTSTATFSLSGGTTNSADILIGSTTAVSSGTGSKLGSYTNSVTGTIAVGLNMNSASAQQYSLPLPAGYYFAIRQTGGTVAITSVFDQAVG